MANYVQRPELTHGGHATGRYPAAEMQVTEASRRWAGGRATSQQCSNAPGVSAIPARQSVAHLALLVVYQICGAPFTPAFSIAASNSAEAANALTFSRL